MRTLRRLDQNPRRIGIIVQSATRIGRLGRAQGLHPRQAAIIDVPDARTGSRLVLVLEHSAIEVLDPLVETFNLRAPPFARLEESLAISHLPRSPLGKLRRGELRQWVVANQVANQTG